MPLELNLPSLPGIDHREVQLCSRVMDDDALHSAVALLYWPSCFSNRARREAAGVNHSPTTSREMGNLSALCCLTPRGFTKKSLFLPSTVQVLTYIADSHRTDAVDSVS
jgi:hypothetical protein